MKNKKIIIGVLTVVIVIFIGSYIYVNDVFVGMGVDIKGEGTEKAPFVIYSFEGLEKIGTAGYPLDAYYLLGKDIDASPTQDESYNYGRGWKAIGDLTDIDNKEWKGFNGIFDGQGYSIKNFYIKNNSDYTGLFYVIEEGTVKNINFDNINITGKKFVGALACINDGTIENISISGKVNGDNMIGGLVAGNDEYGIIKESSSSADVSGNFSLGGLVGGNAGKIEDSYTTGNVKGKIVDDDSDDYYSFQRIGGLVGNNNGLVNNTFTTGDIYGTLAVGGVAGYNRGEVRKSTAAGYVKGDDDVGGLVGSNENLIENCYTTANIKANGSVGGIAGNNQWGSINKTYTVGRIDGSSYSNTKAVAGNNEGVYNSFYRVGMGEAYCAGERTSILDLKQEETYRSFDYEDDWDFDDIWAIDEGHSYPYLRNNYRDYQLKNGLVEENTFNTNQKYTSDDNYSGPDITGNGNEEDPFIIYTLAGLEKIGTKDYPLNAYYRLGRDIDAGVTRNKDYQNGKGWMPIGKKDRMVTEYDESSGDPFTGVFDGQGYKIKNLYIYWVETNNAGLFAAIEGTIMNVNLVDVNIKGNSAGGLAASNKGEIEHCSVTGIIEADSTLGGLVSRNEGTITNSKTKVDIESLGDVGGLVGFNAGDIIDSSVEGKVAGNIYIGGLTGVNTGTVSTSHAVVNLEGNIYIGGLVGLNEEEGIIEKSYAKGDVAGYDRTSGGLVGHNKEGEILSCYAVANVKNHNSAGGLVGVNNSLIENSYAVGNVKANYDAGGLVGYNRDTVNKSYAYAEISSLGDSGGLIGDGDGDVNFSFWNKEKSGQEESYGGKDVTIEEMIQVSAYEGWDFENIWTIEEGKSFPYFSWQKDNIFYPELKEIDEDESNGEKASEVVDKKSSGEIEWKHKLGRINSSPALSPDGETIYMLTKDDAFYAVSTDGQTKWNKDIENFYSNPVIGEDGTVYVVDDRGVSSRLYALEEDGSEKWFLPIPNVDSSPALGQDGTIYLNIDVEGLIAVSPDGNKKWNYNMGNSYSSPAVAEDGTIYIVNERGLHAVNPDGSEKWVWEYPYFDYLSDGIYSSPALAADGTIYIGSHEEKFYAVIPDGTVRWVFETKGMVNSSAAVAEDGTIYVGTEAGYLYALTISGEEKWNVKLDGVVDSSPVVGADGTIYVGTGIDKYNNSEDKPAGKIYAVNNDGNKKWSIDTGYIDLSSGVISENGVLYIGSDDGYLYAVKGVSMGVADSVWPMFGHDPYHRGRQ
ncbi:MAG: PQQ-binding-like beta-propeller repeat protein [Halothermotrichaceae bacterium]